MRLPYALLAPATAAWSPLRLEQAYLACASRKLPKFEVFTSFRSISNKQGDHSLFARDFYNAFLAYWPPEHQLIILHEADERTARPVSRLVSCLRRATCVSQPVAKPFDLPLYEHKVADTSQQVNANFTSIDDVQMQAWKYVLDLYSEAELLGVLDDDACLLDHVIRGDLVSCADKIIVRGVRFERRPIKTKHETSNAFLGISSDVNFMVLLPCSSALQSGVSLGCSRSVECIRGTPCPSLSPACDRRRRETDAALSRRLSDATSPASRRRGIASTASRRPGSICAIDATL